MLRNIESDISALIKLRNETKPDSSCPNAQFHINEYQFPPPRKDRNKNERSKLVYIKDGIKAKRLEKTSEGKHSNNICLEVTISKKNWYLIFA